MSGLDSLKSAIRAEAERTEMSFDREVYARAGRDPLDPILSAGNLTGSVAFLARDLGRDEVLQGEPLIGGAGRRVRRALHTHLFHTQPPAGDPFMHPALERVLLTNTVPYKPVGNKAYPTAVREQFRPYIAALLGCLWQGEHIVTLGTEAFLWFAKCAPPGVADAFWKRPDRYEAAFRCTLAGELGGQECRRDLTVYPLPHPSPLNQTYLARFPAMLEARLNALPLA